MKQAALIAMLAGFGIGLVVIAEQRGSSDPLAVIIGVLVGLAASVPTSLLVVALLRQRQNRGR